MLENVKYCFRRYVGFSGRASRTEYWSFYVFNTVVALALFALGILFVDISDGIEVVMTVPMIFVMLYGLATFLPSLAVSVRRLHDTGKSGAYYLLCIIPGVVFGIAFSVMESSQYSSSLYGAANRLIFAGKLAIIAYICMIIGSILLVAFMLMKSDKGVNKYGPDPHEINPHTMPGYNQFGQQNNPFGQNNQFGQQNNPFGQNNQFGQQNNPFGQQNNPFGQTNQFGQQNTPFGQSNRFEQQTDTVGQSNPFNQSNQVGQDNPVDRNPDIEEQNDKTEQDNQFGPTGSFR